MKKRILFTAFIILALTGCADTGWDKETAASSSIADNEPATGNLSMEEAVHWSNTEPESHEVHTLPHVQEAQKEESVDLFEELAGLDYRSFTCDGLPEYRLTAEDGTVYAINFSESWVWRENSEQAELPEELAVRLKEYPSGQWIGIMMN